MNYLCTKLPARAEYLASTFLKHDSNLIIKIESSTCFLCLRVNLLMKENMVRINKQRVDSFVISN